MVLGPCRFLRLGGRTTVGLLFKSRLGEPGEMDLLSEQPYPVAASTPDDSLTRLVQARLPTFETANDHLDRVEFLRTPTEILSLRSRPCPLGTGEAEIVFPRLRVG